MITLTNTGSAIKFTFDGNSMYLQDGTIEVPFNSLTLVTDNSGMATFKKSATNDIFISATYDELGMTKSQLETWFKDNACSTGGGGGIPSGDVQTMIDQSISGKADSVSAVSSAEYVSSSTTINFKNIDGTVISSIDASDFVIDGMIDDVRIETISGVTYLVIDFNTASGKEDIQIPLTDIFDPSNYYTKTEVDQAISGKADSSTVATLSGEVSDMGEVTARALVDLQANKVDTSAITTSVTSASTDSEIPSAKAVWEAASGGGKAISAGTNISVTTGETADTVSCTLPISADSKGIYTTSTYPFLSTSNKSGNVVFGYNNRLDTFGPSKYSNYNLFFGSDNHITVNGSGMLIGGLNNKDGGNYTSMSACVALGNSNIVKNPYEFASGRFNQAYYNSTSFGNSGNTLFSVGNGTADNARHSAFEIRQNGDIYIADTNDTSTSNYYEKPMIKLQDNLGGGISSGEVQTMIDESISGKADSSAVYTKSEVDAAVSGKADTTAVTLAISEAVSGKQDTLVSGTNIKTINNESILGNGNITIQGGGNATVELTQAEYDALVTAGTVSADTYYIITDAQSVDISQYWTSAQTTSAITEAVSGKVNTSSIVTAITSGSTDSQVPSAKAVYDTLGGLKLQQITQADYDALVQAGTVDASTLYIITNVVS